MKYSTPIILFLLPLSSALPFLHPRVTPALEAITTSLVFNVTMPAFQTARNAQDPPELDWTSDNCSYSPDNPFGFDFVDSCQRHDFAYRNYKAQDRFTDENKAAIDLNFRGDLYNWCDANETEGSNGVCRDTANVYYEAVKVLGRRDGEEEEEEEGEVVEGGSELSE